MNNKQRNMTPGFSKWIFIFMFPLIFAGQSFSQDEDGDDFPRDQRCSSSSNKKVVFQSFLDGNKVVFSEGNCELHCRLICGGRSSVAFSYWVQDGLWKFYHKNGELMATGEYEIKSRMGTDNRGRPEKHFFAVKKGKWNYYNNEGVKVILVEVKSLLDPLLQELRKYNVNEDW